MVVSHEQNDVGPGLGSLRGRSKCPQQQSKSGDLSHGQVAPVRTSRDQRIVAIGAPAIRTSASRGKNLTAASRLRSTIPETLQCVLQGRPLAKIVVVIIINGPLRSLKWVILPTSSMLDLFSLPQVRGVRVPGPRMSPMDADEDRHPRNPRHPRSVKLTSNPK